MAKRRFWSGFAAGAAVGAAAGVGSWLVSKTLGRQEYGKIMRLEKSLQIGRPIEEVFAAWADLASLPQHVPLIEDIRVNGKRSHWKVRLDGRRIEWDAVRTQRVDNQALGWKSVGGPKHTGRINFARLGNDTMVHVVMNYAPPAGLISSGVVEAFGRIEGILEQALRDFKASLEGKGQEQRATGTHGYSSGGRELNNPSRGMAPQISRFGGVMNAIEANEASARGGDAGVNPPNPVEFNSPPDAKR